ncbi:Raf kinase inhibitor-like YbhB/YbcL family protein [Nocardia sp. GAS34]|uniref:YbhB/YbcL family Raf kinase inhibitor-like protein n=1 Tax=unclassified Nocardia TaxID=2637762 RepID=UPI003D2360F2
MNRKALTVAAITAAGLLAATVTSCSSTNSASNAVTSEATPAAVPAAGSPYAYLPKAPTFTLTSTTVTDGKPLPTPELSGIFKVPGGQDRSPQLSWSGFPAQTKSFVVSMYDPQAPTGSGFWHWIVTDLPATTTALPENAGTPNSTAIPAGAFQLDGDGGAPRYIGGAPPAGSGVHNYYITVTALDIDKSGVTPTTSAAMLGFTIGGHTIARATIICPTTS